MLVISRFIKLEIRDLRIYIASQLLFYDLADNPRDNALSEPAVEIQIHFTSPFVESDCRLNAEVDCQTRLLILCKLTTEDRVNQTFINFPSQLVT